MEIRKFYDEIEKLRPKLKLVLSCNFKLELWGLVELLNLINTEIKGRADFGEYNFIQGNEFGHLDLQSASALASQTSKSNYNKCVFCLGQHWLDKCDVITNTENQKKKKKIIGDVLIV